MKAQVLFLLTLFSLNAFSQRVLLSIDQDYIPIITQKGDSLVSSIVYGNQWIKDGVLLVGKTAGSLLATQKGDYEVIVMDAKTGCTSKSNVYKILTSATPLVQVSDMVCRVSPNPSKGLFQVFIDFNRTESVKMTLLSVDGKVMVEKNGTLHPGKQQIPFGKSTLAGGVYTLQLQVGTETTTQKVVVE